MPKLQSEEQAAAVPGSLQKARTAHGAEQQPSEPAGGVCAAGRSLPAGVADGVCWARAAAQSAAAQAQHGRRAQQHSQSHQLSCRRSGSQPQAPHSAFFPVQSQPFGRPGVLPSPNLESCQQFCPSDSPQCLDPVQ